TCCFQSSTTGIDGVQTTTTFDVLGRITSEVRSELTAYGGYPEQPALVTQYAYSSDGTQNRVTKSVAPGDNCRPALVTSHDFDKAGRLSRAEDSRHLVTSYDYDTGSRSVTATYPGGRTETTERYLDGRTKCVHGDGTLRHFYQYFAGNGQTRTRVDFQDPDQG